MTVGELIVYLTKCDLEYRVDGVDGTEINWVIQHTDFTNSENSYVEIA